LPVTTSIRLDSSRQKVERLNTSERLYWDEADIDEIRAMVLSQNTVMALSARLAVIGPMLEAIPELKSTAQFYRPDQISVDRILKSSLKRFSSGVVLPELLSSLLFMEAKLVESAIQTGLEMAAFQKSAASDPAGSLARLAKFGEDFSAAFNQAVGSNPFLDGAARPLGTLLFVEAARLFDPTLAEAVSARMDVTVVQSGKFSVDDMLAGKIAGSPADVMFSQPFVEA
jgi:hypothetical protein